MPQWLEVQPNNVPDELKAIENWMIWRSSGNQKISLSPETFKAIDRRDKTARMSFDAANELYAQSTGIDGVAFYLEESLGIVALDIDGSLDWRKFNVDSYAELSPSGSGVHVFCLAEGLGAIRKKRKEIGIDYILTDEWYVCVTGHIVSEQAWLTDQTARIQELLGFDDVNGEPETPILPGKFFELVKKPYVKGLWEFGDSYKRLGGQQLVDQSSADLAIAGIAYTEGWSYEEIKVLLVEYRSRAVAAGWTVNKIEMGKREDYLLRTYQKVVDGATSRLSGIEVLTLDDAIRLQPPKWIVEGMIPAEETFGELFGRRSAAKTFLALDIALKVTHGIPWFGRASDPGDVLYILGEGRGILGERLRAWRSFYGEPEQLHTLAIWPRAQQLIDPQHVGNIVMFLKHKLKRPKLLVIDTLARCTVGIDENTSEMGKVAHAITNICQSTGVTALVLHHSPKSDTTERGHSSVGDAADFMFHMLPLRYKYWVGPDQHQFPIKGVFELVNDKQRIWKEWQHPVSLYLKPVEESAVLQISTDVTEWLKRRSKFLSGVPGHLFVELYGLHRKGLASATIEKYMNGRLSRKVIEGVVEELESYNKKGKGKST